MMLRVVLFSFSIYTCCLIGVRAQTGWEKLDVSVESPGHWRDGVIFNDTLMTIHTNGYILRSTDFGKHITVDSTFKGGGFMALDFPTPYFGVISSAGAESSMIYTEDGGLVWLENENCIFQGGLGTSLDFVSPGLGYFSFDGWPSMVYHVSSASCSVLGYPTPQEIEEVKRISFINDSTGYCIGASGAVSKLYKTDNGGVDWMLAGASPILGGADFFVFPNGIIFLLFNSNILRYDENTGVLDTVFHEPNPESIIHAYGYPMKSLSFSDSLNGFAAFSGSVYRTVDGGWHWERTDMEEPTEGYFLFVRSYGAQKAMVGTSNGDLYVTSTGGMLDMEDISPPLGIHAYPNPTTGQLNLKVPSGAHISRVQVINNLGQTMWAGPFTQPLDVSLLSEGVYFVRLLNENGLFSTAKFVKR